MSNEVLAALITAGFGLIGAFIGAWIAILVQSKIAYKQIHNSFQLAAMEKRLEAHQKAYYIWSKMASYVFAPHEHREKIRNEAVKFFTKNCLYLEENAAKHFRLCASNYYEYKTQLDFINLLDRHAPETKQQIDELRLRWNQIHETDRYIMEGAKYPFIDLQLSKEDPLGQQKEETVNNK